VALDAFPAGDRSSRRPRRRCRAAFFRDTDAAAGVVFIAENDSLYGYPFDFKALAFSGERVLIANDVKTFSASSNGSFAYRAAPYSSLDLAWVDRSGTPQSRIHTEGFGNDIELSPDERHAAIVQLRDRNFDIWIVDLARAVTSRFTTGPSLDRWPQWSADSRRLAYASGTAIVAGVRGGTAAVDRLVEGATEAMPSDWGPDGSLIYRVQRPDGTGDLLINRPGASNNPFRFAVSDFEETRAQFSPDGRWIAYESNQSGRMEVYVRPFMRDGEEVQVSVAGGVCVRWRPDGREIYYLDPQSKLTAADVKMSVDGREVTFGVPHALFVASIAGRGAPGANFKTNYDVARDGRFLMLVPNDAAQNAMLSVIHDWNPTTPPASPR
jgi:hypothetical protein